MSAYCDDPGLLACAALEARARPVVDGAACCLDGDSAEDVYMSALEADHAAGRALLGARSLVLEEPAP